MTIRLPELLDRELHTVCRLEAVSLRLDERLAPLSTAVLVIVPRDPVPMPGDFVRLYTEHGDAGVYRVQVTERRADGLMRAELQHGICTLADHVLFGTRDYLGLDTGGDTGATITVGTVSVNSVAIRSGPSASAAVLGRLNKGEQVAVTGASRSWYAVTAGSIRGWMSKACVRDTGEAVPDLGTILTDLLAAQPSEAAYWQAGTVAAAGHAGCSFSDQHLLTALLTLPECAAEDLVWHFDQSSLPWRVSLVRPGQSVCELRAARNVTSYTVTASRSGLCTRLYPRGADGLTIAEINGGLDYLQSDTAATEGIVSRIYRCPQEQNAAALLTGARRVLAASCTPRLSVECEAVDLSVRTGEDRDRIEPGRRCVCVLKGQPPAELIVTGVLRRDVYGKPGCVTVTLAEAGTTLTSLMNNTRQSRVSVL